MNYTPINEKESLLIQAMTGPRRDGWNPWAVYCQAWHETGNFKKVIGMANYWGITKPQKWAGKVLSVPTHEYIHGERVEMTREFIDWDTTSEALFWYMSLIRRLYPQAYINRSNPLLFFVGLCNGKNVYATDPNYVPQLEAIYRKLSTNKELEAALKGGQV